MYLSTRLDTLHEAKENDDPGEEESQGQVVFETSEVSRFFEAGGDI